MVERTLMTGNDAIGEGAIRAGCDAYYGYPITPQNELTAYMATHMPRLNRVFIQAESEIAAINMVFGSVVAGKRAMTSSSSPGISLKQEGISNLAAAELPAVIVNVMRGGPGIGNIAPSQGDYFQAVKGGGHGDYRLPVLAPSSVQESHDLTIEAFALADRYRTPVMILTDGRIGQMMEPLRLHSRPIPPPPPKPWALTGAKGRKSIFIRSLMLNDGDLEKHNIHLQAKFKKIAAAEVRFQETAIEDCDLLLVAYGTSARVAKSALEEARRNGLRVGLLRPITLWPFPSQRIAMRSSRCRAVLCVEMSAGQMVDDVRLAVNGRTPVLFEGRMGGAVPEARDVFRAIQKALAPSRKKRTP
jgi:2-oxoglutarate ferredoxin oxidoreductase subunit alpha